MAPRKSSSRSSRSRRTAAWNLSPLATTILIGVVLFILWRTGELQRMLDDLFGATGDVPTQPAAPAAPIDPDFQAIEAFFTTPTLVYPDRRDQRGPSPLLSAVVDDINAAQRSVDIAVFDFEIPAVTDAMLQARQRGVRVRLVTDDENLTAPEVAEETGRLQDAGIDVRFDEREPFMHNKFVVIDGAIAWTGSWNITANDTWRNNNNMIRVANRNVAAKYSAEFEQMLAGAFGLYKEDANPSPAVQVGQVPMEVYFSPRRGIGDRVVEYLNGAQQEIAFMAFSYTSDPIADAMINMQRAGVPVRGVMESQNADGTGSEFARLERGGVDILRDGSCYIMHHKVIIIDRQIVITGSYNFTASADRDNDENLVVVRDAALAEQYMAEFERVYAQAQNPTRCR